MAIIVLAGLLATTLIGGIFGIIAALFQVFSLYKYSTKLEDIALNPNLSDSQVISQVSDISFFYSMRAFTILLAPIWQGAGNIGIGLRILLTGMIAEFILTTK